MSPLLFEAAGHSMYITPYFLKFLKYGGRVVSAANRQPWGHDFVSSRIQNFFRRNPNLRTIRCLLFLIKY